MILNFEMHHPPVKLNLNLKLFQTVSLQDDPALFQIDDGEHDLHDVRGYENDHDYYAHHARDVCDLGQCVPHYGGNDGCDCCDHANDHALLGTKL